MASIEISELRPIGSDLFLDSESFLNELSDRSMWSVEGGAPSAPPSLSGLLSGSLGESLGQTFGYGGFNLTGPDSAQSLIDLKQLVVVTGAAQPNA